jgi:hypothetical protein
MPQESGLSAFCPPFCEFRAVYSFASLTAQANYEGFDSLECLEWLPDYLDAGCGLRFKSARAYHFCVLR